MGTPEHADFGAALIGKMGDDTSAAQVAERLGGYCAAIDAVLNPILGRRGVAALMHRSLRVASATHPWLATSDDGMPTSFDVSALTDAVSRQAAGNARASAVALIRTFQDLLASLIGAALTEQLLTPIVIGPPSAPIVPGHTE